MERDLVTGYQPFDKVSQLREGLVGRVPPLKTLNMVSSKAEAREVSQILASNAVPQGFKVEVRIEESKDAYRYLLGVSKRHQTLLADGLTPEFVSRTFDLETLEFEQKLAAELDGGQISQVTPAAPPSTDDPPHNRLVLQVWSMPEQDRLNCSARP